MPTAIAAPTITIQWVSSAIVWVASVVDHTEDRATIAPTERSMPPPVITKVIPTETTPITEASRRMVSALSTLAKLSPAVQTPTPHRMSRATTRPALRPTDDPITCCEEAAALRRTVAGQRGLGLRLVARLGGGGDLPFSRRHAALPSITRSRTLCSSMSFAGPSCTTTPSRTTRTRSARPSTSSTSLDTTTTASPRDARERMRA